MGAVDPSWGSVMQRRKRNFQCTKQGRLQHLQPLTHLSHLLWEMCQHACLRGENLRFRKPWEYVPSHTASVGKIRPKGAGPAPVPLASTSGYYFFKKQLCRAVEMSWHFRAYVLTEETG